MTKTELYLSGLQAAHEFLELNGIPDPEYHMYTVDQSKLPKYVAAYFRRGTLNGRTVGSGTGLYYDGHVFVNIPVTASPVKEPAYRSWSWPGWKTDRTAMGVVAHEVGHYVEEVLRRRGKLTVASGAEWRELIALYKKRVSGYEPVPDEAWAETMRLFILNPALLCEAMMPRYEFIFNVAGLRPVKALMKRGWRKVLGNKNYTAAAERWIGATR